MMEEEESQKKDEAFLMFSKNTLGNALSLTVGTAKASTQNYNKSDFDDGRTGAASTDNELVNNQTELVSLEGAQPTASEKALGTFEVLCTSSSEMPVSGTTTHVLATDSSRIISSLSSTTTSCGKVGQGHQKLGQTDISPIPQNAGSSVQSQVDMSAEGSECTSETAAGNRTRQVTINHMGIMDTYRQKLALSGGPKTTCNSSYFMEAHDINKNNNNIDKPLNANNTDVSHSFMDQKECQLSSVNSQIWNQVPHCQGEKFNVYSSGNGTLMRPSPPANASASQSDSWLRNDNKSGCEYVPAGLPSYNQSLPTVSSNSMTVNESKGAVVLHGTSGSMVFSTEPSLARKECTFQSFSLAEPVKSATVSVVAPAVSTFSGSVSQRPRTGVDVQPATANVFRQQLASSSTVPSAAVSIHHKATFSSRPETQSGMQMNHTKSTMHKASEHFKNISTKGGDRRASTTSRIHSSGLPENKLSTSNRNQTELAPSLQPTPAHLSAASGQVVAPYRQSSSDTDNKAATYMFSGERRETAPKLTRKAHSRSPKPKLNKTAQLTADDDDDDDNDFIPVGMLQMSSSKIPEDNGTAASNVEFDCGEKNVGTVYQLNQGLNVIYKQLNHDQVQSTDKTSVEQVSGSVQEKLKQKVQQQKLKQLASVGQEQSLQVQGLTSQKLQEQGFDPQRHQLLFQLVQQQQRLLQDEQPHLLLSHSSLLPAASGQSKSPGSGQSKSSGFLKNQGLIIHHHQAEDVKLTPSVQSQQNAVRSPLTPSVQSRSPQNAVRGPEMKTEQNEDQQCRQEQNIQQLAEVNFKNTEKRVSVDKSFKQHQRDQKYSQQCPATTCPTDPAGQLQQLTAETHQESQWQVQSSNIPKIAERLLQQSLNEQIFQQGRAEQMISHCKNEQSTQSLSHSVTRSDPRPLTPASSHHAMPSVNQQHPEIARRLSSPVSPRQPASPRQAVSPRGTASPIQVSATSSHFSHQHLVSPNPRKSPGGLHQPASCKSVSSMNSSGLYPPASLKQTGSTQPGSDSRQVQHSDSRQVQHSDSRQVQHSDSRQVQHSDSRQVQHSDSRQVQHSDSRQVQHSDSRQVQHSDSRQVQHSADSSTNIQPLARVTPASQRNQQFIPEQFPASQRKFEPARTDVIQPVTTHSQQLQYSQNQQQSEDRIQRVTADRQHMVADISITLPNSDVHQFNLSQTIPLSQTFQSFSPGQTVQSFSPGQIIHYRPPEHKNAQSKVPVIPKTQPSALVQLPAPSVSLTKSPMSLTQPAHSAWHTVSGQGDSKMTIQPASFHSPEPVNTKRPNRKLLVLEANQPPERKPFWKDYVKSEVCQSQVKDEIPMAVNFKSQICQQDKYDEGQLKPSVQPISTHADMKSASSYMSSANSRHFQTIADLTEKEASFLQSLFATVPAAEVNERMPHQELYPVPQTPASYMCPLEEPMRSCDGLEIHTPSATLYPEVRKNEGGLKVLSEIASKRYALDVAGKEGEADQVTCAGAEDRVPQAAHGIPQVALQSKQASVKEMPVLSPMIATVSDTEPAVATHKKSGDEQDKTNQSVEAKDDISDADTKPVDRETKDSLVTHGETPRREVRQRKPKKPFEQEEMHIKRPSKVSPQKNLPGKRQTQVASAQNPTHKKGHSLREKTSEVKQKEEVEKEDNKVFIRQTRSTAENKLTDNEKGNHTIEDSENGKQGEFDSPSRRLSGRLQKKEIEMSQQKQTEDNESRVSGSHQPARMNNKEDVSDENTSTVTTRSSRRVSISSSDDNMLPETSERMRTRSKNRSVDDKVVSSGGKTMENPKQSSQSNTEKKSFSISKTGIPNAAVTSNKENRKETRNSSKSPSHDSQSQSPAHLTQTTPIMVTRRATRQTVVELQSPKSSLGVKNKRLLIPAPAEELLQWQKRMKKLDMPTVVLESFKLPDGKTGIVKEETPKDNARDKEVVLKEVAKPETEIVKVKQTKNKKRQKSRKRRNRQKLPQSAARQDLKRSEHDDSEDSDMLVVEHEENSQEKDLLSDSDNREQGLSSEIQEVKGERSSMQTAEKNTENMISSQKSVDHEEATDKVQEEAKDDEVSAKSDDMDSSETKEQTIRTSEDVLLTEPDIAEQQSVIKCTSAFVHPVAKSPQSPHSTVPSSPSAAACPLPHDKNISLTTPTGGRQRMLMYKLVPVQEEVASHTQDCLIPFSGFLISGSSDRVLIPHDLMHKPVPSTSPSSSAGFDTSLSSSSSSLSVGLPSTLGTLALTDLSRSEMLLSSRALGPSLAQEVVSTSGSIFECLPTIYSPMKCGQRTGVECTPSSAVWASPSPISSVSAVFNLSPWTPQWSSCSAQTTASAGEALVTATSRVPSAVTQPSQLPYRSSQSWNTTPSSSSLSPFPTSSSAWDSSASAPLPAGGQQQEQSWPATSHQSPQEPPWSSSPSVTEVALETWSKEYLPSVSYTNSRIHSQLQHTHSSPQTVLASPGYSMETGSSQQSQMYASNNNLTDSSAAQYSTGAATQETEFVDSRQESLIQSYLRQVAANPSGFSHELAGFSLGQQDLAYLENRLRQSPSPNTLFSAVAAYDDASGQGNIVGHDNSLQESISLVHTVNLDMEEGHLENSNNLDLSDLRNNLASSLSMSRNVDAHRTGQYNREGSLNDDSSVGVARDSCTQQDAVVADNSGAAKNDGKKPIRERKSQYEIVMQDNAKRYRCLLCEKNFGVTTIYRHLRTHDPDYKVSCSLCGKQYTQRQSLVVHWQKTHGDHTPSPDLMKSPNFEQLSSSEPLQLSHGNPPGSQLNFPDGALVKPSGALIRSPGAYIKSPSDPKRQRRTSSNCDQVTAVYDQAGISKQEAAHKQVEELRRLKAENKLAAAQRKTEGHISDDGTLAGDSLLQGICESSQLADEDDMNHTDRSNNRPDFARHQTEQSTLAYEQNLGQKTSFPGSTATADSCPVTSTISSNLGEDYANLAVLKLENVADNQFHFSSSQTFVPTVPQFHADNIPRPISTPVVKSNHSTEPSCPKEVMSGKDKPHLKALNTDGKYACELCTTVLNTKNSYILHMRRHSNIKTKFCSYCDKGFHTMQELRSHERTHTGERPYNCEICHTMFAHSGSYVSHKKSHEKRGELEPFPIIDGRIEYPPTFKKPRLSGGVEGGGEKSRRVKKKKETVPTLKTMESVQSGQNLNQGDHQLGVIRGNHLENLQEQGESAGGEFRTGMPGQWHNLGQQSLASEQFRPSIDSPGGGDCSIKSETLRVVTTAHSLLPLEQGNQSMLALEQGNQRFIPPGEDYSSLSGTVPDDYFGGTVGYNQNTVQQKFLSPHTDASSPHGFYKQDKYTPRASSAYTYPTDSQNLATSLPTSIAADKSMQHASSHSYSNSGQGTRTYYSPQQHSSEYPYAVPRQNEDYPQDDYDESLAQYKGDPSSSEIVKKLLQHYNVPASPFQDAVPIDYSHQIQEEADYSQIGHGQVSEYSELAVGRSTPAPPSYSATIGSLQKLYYNSQSSSSGYGSSVLRQQSVLTQDQGGLNLRESRQHQLLQSLGVNDGQFGSAYSQGQHQDVYSSADRCSSSQSNQNTRFASPSLP